MPALEYITDKDGNKISLLILTGNIEPLYIMIVCHGFRGRKENSGKLIPFARKLNRLGIGVVAFDFRGSGESDGDFATVTLSRQVDDLRWVLSYAAERFQCPLLLLGRSFGGSTVAASSPYPANVAACIFWSTAINLHRTFADMLEKEYLRLKVGETINITDEGGTFQLHPDIIKDFDRHDLPACLNMLDLPVLVIHGGQDEIVHPDNARSIIKMVRNGELVLVEGADHRFTEYTAKREDLTIDWIKKHFMDYSGGKS